MPRIRAKKKWGQHFLHDRSVLERMVQCMAPQPTDHVIEIGPGLGALTCSLLPYVHHVDAVELDADLIPLLRQNTIKYKEKITIFQQDALKINLSHHLMGRASSLRVVGNLPYNIATPLLFHLLEQAEYIEDMHLMLQQEVADRLSAQPNCKDYGRLSLMVQLACKVVCLFHVGPEAFHPQPQVHSTVVRLTPYHDNSLLVDDFQLFDHIVKKAFTQRRKTLGKSLKGIVSSEDFKALSIQTTDRAEQLTLQEFVALSNSLAHRGHVL